MKLFHPEYADHFIFAVCPKGYREGTKPNFAPVKAVDVETARSHLDSQRLVHVYPYVCGRFDEHGRYMTYCPPVDGVKPGKYLLHPLAAEEHKRQRAYA